MIKYKREAGTINRGQEYENKVLCLLALRACQPHMEIDAVDFRTKVEHMMPLDDIILNVSQHGVNAHYFIEVRHQEYPKPLNIVTNKKNNDLNINRFCDKYDEIINTNDYRNKNVKFVIFTNRPLEDNNTGVPVRDDDETITKLFNTQDGVVYKLNMENEYVKNNLTLNNFAANTYIFTNQQNVHNIDKDILESLKILIPFNKLIEADNESKNIMFHSCILKKFSDYISNYAQMKTDDILPLTKELIIKLLTLSQIENRNEIKSTSIGYSDDAKQFWDILKQYNHIIINKNSLTFLWNYVYKEIVKYAKNNNINFNQTNFSCWIKLFYANLLNKDLKPISRLYIILWLMDEIPLIIRELDYLALKHICSEMRLIVVKNYKSNKIETSENSRSIEYFSKLDSANVNAMLKMEVSLQGRKHCALNKILPNDSRLNTVTISDIINILCNKKYIIGNMMTNRVISDEAVFSVPSKDLFITETPALTTNEFDFNQFASRLKDDFEIIQCLGKGGYGIVYEVKQKIVKRAYAIKRITLPSKKNSCDRVLREAEALANLDHVNIVRYYHSWLESSIAWFADEFDKKWMIAEEEDGEDMEMTPSIDINLQDSWNTPRTDSCGIVFENSGSAAIASTSASILPSTTSNSKMCDADAPSGRVDTYLYIQMELCQKDSLKEWLLSNPHRTHSTIINIYKQILLAVIYLHRQGLIHRDLKPSNIFFSKDDEVKVGDFGLVTTLNEYNADGASSIESLKSHTKGVGTTLYMSPEQLVDQRYNYKVDIFSLGVILFELLVPFGTAMERSKVLSELLRDGHYPAHFASAHAPEHKLLECMLSEAPETRPSAEDVLKELTRN